MEAGGTRLVRLDAVLAAYARNLDVDIAAVWRPRESPNMSMFSGRIKRVAIWMTDTVNN